MSPHAKFYEEIEEIEPASYICLEMLIASANELRAKFNLTKLEYERYRNKALKEFLEKAETQIEELLKKADIAQMSYPECPDSRMS